MKNILLIENAFQEKETRIAVLRKGILEDFDCETEQHRLKKGNIYLAKVARIEPSLQAVFLDYGEEKHGFLAFSEIHPSYYHIPAHLKDKKKKVEPEVTEVVVEEKVLSEEEPLEVTDSDEDGEDLLKARSAMARGYKVQDVIQKGQTLLVQVIKDVRGTKGAAFSTYISLAGRYSVFMPNTPGNARVSRKISEEKERKRLKEIAQLLEIPEGMSIIFRTAVVDRSKREITRDYDYLARLWSDLKQRSVVAPTLLHEESDLVIRALRDLYSNDLDEIYVQGEHAFRKARGFMRMLMPTHVKRVKLYQDEAISLFEKFQLEDQLLNLYKNEVQLTSGGYIVINQTEALVSVDVNSGKSTKERHMEETAFKTNLEAASTIARELRLRDLSGLIVVDFIDMPAHKHNAVEKALKDALKSDRARTQIGKIGPFGLLEMSRQRLRQSLFESHSQLCPICHGQGRVFSVATLAVRVLRDIRFQAQSCLAGGTLHVTVPLDVAVVLLNQYRAVLSGLEQARSMTIHVGVDPHMKHDTHLVRVSCPAVKIVVEPSTELVVPRVVEEKETEKANEEKKPLSSGARRRSSRKWRKEGPGDLPQTKREPSSVEDGKAPALAAPGGLSPTLAETALVSNVILLPAAEEAKETLEKPQEKLILKKETGGNLRRRPVRSRRKEDSTEEQDPREVSLLPALFKPQSLSLKSDKVIGTVTETSSLPGADGKTTPETQESKKETGGGTRRRAPRKRRKTPEGGSSAEGTPKEQNATLPASVIESPEQVSPKEVSGQNPSSLPPKRRVRKKSSPVPSLAPSTEEVKREEHTGQSAIPPSEKATQDRQTPKNMITESDPPTRTLEEVVKSLEVKNTRRRYRKNRRFNYVPLKEPLKEYKSEEAPQLLPQKRVERT